MQWLSPDKREVPSSSLGIRTKQQKPPSSTGFFCIQKSSPDLGKRLHNGRKRGVIHAEA